MYRRMMAIVVLLSAVFGLSLVAYAQTATVGANCTISWNANSEADLASYRVYGVQGGVTKTLDVAKPATSTTCAALGTQAGGSLAVQVDAVDLVGNRSAKSVTVTVTQDIAGPLQPTGVTVTPNP